MKFAYSTNAFKRYPLEEAVRLIKETGFDGVEIMADRPHLYPPDYLEPVGVPLKRDELHDLLSRSEIPHLCGTGSYPDTKCRDKQSKITALKELLASLGLKVSNLNTFTLEAVMDMHHPSWIEKDAGLRRRRIQHTRDCLELAAQLNCANISIQPGGKVEHLPSEESMELFIAGLNEVIPLAKQLKVKILVEPEPNLLMENSRQFADFIRRVDASIIGLNCDVGHFYCAGEDPAAVIRNLAGHIHHLHIEDIKHRIHNHIICGQGEMDFKSIFDALRDIKYDGFVSVELYPYQDNPVAAGQASLDFLKRFVI